MAVRLDLCWTGDTETVPSGMAHAAMRGDDEAWTFRLWLDATQTTPYVPTGTLEAQVRQARLRQGATPDTPLATFGLTVGGDDGNEVTLTLSDTDTLALSDAWEWDLQETLDDVTTTWLFGSGRTLDDVTR